MNPSRWLRICALGAVLFAIPAASQRPDEEPDIKLPSGKSQRNEILKDEHRKSLEDIERLLAIGAELQAELKKNDYAVLSIPSIKKAEELEKLARRIRRRLNR